MVCVQNNFCPNVDKSFWLRLFEAFWVQARKSECKMFFVVFGRFGLFTRYSFVFSTKNTRSPESQQIWGQIAEIFWWSALGMQAPNSTVSTSRSRFHTHPLTQIKGRCFEFSSLTRRDTLVAAEKSDRQLHSAQKQRNNRDYCGVHQTGAY